MEGGSDRRDGAGEWKKRGREVEGVRRMKGEKREKEG